MADRRPAVARHELPLLDEAALRAARAFDLLVVAAREAGDERWSRFLEPLPDRLRDDEPAALRRTTQRCRSAFGPGDSVLDALPFEVALAAQRAIDELIRRLARLEMAGDRSEAVQ
ncbi:MAG TPA: hypothetical protein VJZ72_08930 [Candidatus Limnocylindrales bacterium]|nr:hypothetical protein [Candidatus Limnocylindrales bacterium]